MNLKEAFQYQNYLSNLMSGAISCLHPMYVVKCTELHEKSKANPDAEDEEIESTTIKRPVSGDIKVDDIVRFCDAIVRERRAIGVAIGTAKCVRAHMDIDAELAANKSRHQLIQALKRMVTIKPSVIDKINGTSHKINAEGNQTPYVYPVERKTEIDFDRNYIRSVIRNVTEDANVVSKEAEKEMIEVEVNFEPMFDMNDELEDAIVVFVQASRAE